MPKLFCRGRFRGREPLFKTLSTPSAVRRTSQKDFIFEPY
jgi:hypothetical protein